jgi:hypothetical protein
VVLYLENIILCMGKEWAGIWALEQESARNLIHLSNSLLVRFHDNYVFFPMGFGHIKLNYMILYDPDQSN